VISDLGFFAAQLSLVAAAAAVLAGVVGGVTRSDAWTDVARRAV